MTKIPYNTLPETNFLDEIDAVKVSLISYPDVDMSKKMIINVASGYDDPNVYDKLDEQEKNKAIEDIIKDGTLPKCLEMLGKFVFLIENIPLTCTHMWVRERFFTILQMSTATSCQRTANFVMPRSFARDDKFYEKIKNWYLEGKLLYAKGIDKYGLSVQDGRLLIPKNNCNHIFLGFDALAFKNAYARRSCTQEEPIVSTYVFEEMKKQILNKFPYLENLFNSSCSNGSCLHSKSGKHSNVCFKRNELHRKFLPKDYDCDKEDNLLHNNTRDEMNAGDKINFESYLGTVIT